MEQFPQMAALQRSQLLRHLEQVFPRHDEQFFKESDEGKDLTQEMQLGLVLSLLFGPFCLAAPKSNFKVRECTEAMADSERNSWSFSEWWFLIIRLESESPQPQGYFLFIFLLSMLCSLIFQTGFLFQRVVLLSWTSKIFLKAGCKITSNIPIASSLPGW